MDKIYLNGMSFYGYHGVYSEENKLGQRFNADIILKLDLRPAGRTDDLEKTINYADVYNLTKRIIEGPPKKLVEAVAEEIADQLLKTFPRVQECLVKVIKPDPPIPGHYDSVAIELTRGR
ncbi:dihydroneopterin aldolase [Pullulanibacillus camelliae]|uniref:7,8-dihydroneopterin aldolase n=1 Tax=Pullulanibacillus camelliae TaxID=1707096 RepID=A0A8J2YMZ1_9BACL|nr:dihydroneopterin aldolase [Pullulanibacillus camelliae]GGE54163.1 dihydroneopterin aldolase [Pullulanibacillus camelliae]